jgi:DNA (cytosine-5)-methyltransferase 1
MPTKNPIEIIELAYEQAKNKSLKSLLSGLPDEIIRYLKVIVENAESQKAVLGVTLTSLVYKVYDPIQDIRKHQEGMKGGYSGRTFDTKYVTPFLKRNFNHFAMAESAWLTRSLEQPRPFNLNFPGKIRNQNLKDAFLNVLDKIQADNNLATQVLVALMGLMLEATKSDELLFENVEVTRDISIARIIEALSQHIRYNYGKGVVGTARLPVLAIYSVYNIIMPNVNRYSGKILMPLESHTSPDSRSKVLGDIDIRNKDNFPFESVEIKHNKPITADMVGIAYQKIQNTNLDRYYILTTSEPNFVDYGLVMQEIENTRNFIHAKLLSMALFHP